MFLTNRILKIHTKEGTIEQQIKVYLKVVHLTQMLFNMYTKIIHEVQSNSIKTF